MTEVDFTLLVKKLMGGIWEYETTEHCLTKYLGNSQDFEDLGALSAEGNLHPQFKENILSLLGADTLKDVVGPFGDDDIFYGTDYDNITSYYIQLYQVDEANLEALQMIEGVELRELTNGE